MKKFISLALASVMVVAMAAGCSSSTTEETAQETETTEEGTGEEGKVYNVCNLVNGNLGDKSFFDSCEAGLAELRTYYLSDNRDGRFYGRPGKMAELP